MEEIWKDIQGYEGFYQVSNLGKVKSLKRIVKHNKGGNQNIKEKILKQSLTGSGYLTIVLSKNGIKERFLTHRLVCQSFLNNDLTKRTVNHKDCNKLNNELTNLEWMTDSENQIHSLENGIKPKGSNHANSKLTEQNVIEIRNSTLSNIDLSKIYKVAHQTISQIRNRKRWKHI